jgi:hypothetical protein
MTATLFDQTYIEHYNKNIHSVVYDENMSIHLTRTGVKNLLKHIKEKIISEKF